MATELAKTYTAAEVEPQIAAVWKQSKAFAADPAAPGDPYCIVIPPPNVTAALHMGHALNNTLQDILIRYHRMLGDNTLWMPGTDHAGIATQTVVEKRVLKEEGKKRTDFTREEFVKKIQAWKDEYEERITNQLISMGCSCDWDRQRFTMDPICAKAVREAFFRLFKDELIYRGKRLVNWDPATQTALADDEVEMEDVNGHFYYLRYPLMGPPLSTGENYITVATTRPETMLGDTAVAINPRDPRARELEGRFVLLPIVNREIPIVLDDYVVLPVAHGGDPSDPKAQFATGFLKVTPAHDPNDYEIGQRHKLPIINVFAPDGTISKDHGWAAARPDEWNGESTNDTADVGLLGQDRFVARKTIIKFFKDRELFEDARPYRHAVGHSYRSHVPIEPYLSDQWYVKVTDDRLAGAALRAMADDQRTTDAPNPSCKGWEGKLRFYPARYAKNFETWHLNIRDWCISRQLWWGHRIPVWSKAGEGIDVAALKLDPAKAAVQQGPDGKSVFVCVRDLEDTQTVATLEAAGFVQDTDVLDTWFSSALWPFSTMGWPDNTPELAKWNPGNVLCTAREIITLWVSRMVMMNVYLLDQLPFTDVFIHAMIQDGEGRKMSKSLGNGVDPLDIIHSHGSDAMRFTLANMTTNTQDVRMPVQHDAATGRNTSEKFDFGRNFANKLWNATRFAVGNLDGAADPTGKPFEFQLADKWILSRLSQTVAETNKALENYEFSVYAQNLYDFIWRDLCDWYIEVVKPTIKENPTQQRVLAICFDVALRLLHPAMPFITEKLFAYLNEVVPSRGVPGVTAEPAQLLVKAPWPKADASRVLPDVEKDFEFLRQCTSGIREARNTYRIAPRQKVVVTVKAPAPIAQKLVESGHIISTLASVEAREYGPKVDKPANAAAVVVGDVEIYLHDLVDADAERTRIAKRIEELSKTIGGLQGRLGNASYVERAPAHLVQQTREQLEGALREAESLRQQLASLK